MLRAYEGKEPYVFISYSHKDASTVMPIIENMQNAGILVWYDGGIEAGSEWPEYIASHLKNCTCVLTFISENFIASPNCRRELNFAQDLQKEILNVYIDEAKLTDGMRMQLGLNQALIKKNYSSDYDFYGAICNARLLAPCRTAAMENSYTPNIKNQIKSAEKEKRHSNFSRRLLVWITSILEIAYIALGITLITSLTINDEGAWGLIWKTAAGHVAVMLLNAFIYKVLSKEMNNAERSDAMMPALLWCAFSIFVVMIAGPFCIAYDINVFFKILISIGLNIIPLFAAITIYGVFCNPD